MRNQAGRLLAGVAVAGVMAAAGTWSHRSEAATATGSVTVSASVAGNCLVSSPTIVFGAYDPLGANETTNLDQSADFTVRCTKGANAQVGLLNGGNHDGSTRRMVAGAGQFLNYELYREASHSNVWNNSTNRYNHVAASKAPVTLTIYGRVPSGQDPVAGNYGDTVQIEANF
jgi:spore coat protein U-like protein